MDNNKTRNEIREYEKLKRKEKEKEELRLLQENQAKFKKDKKEQLQNRRLILEESVRNIRKTENNKFIQNYISKVQIDPGFLPNDTAIIKYVEDNYGKFLQKKEGYELRKNDPTIETQEFIVSLDDIFNVNPEFNKVEKICNIDTKLLPKPEFTLYKFISYVLYSTSSKWFSKIDSKYKLQIEKFKRQVGADVLRTDIFVNNNEYVIDYGNGQDKDTIEYTKLADEFNINIMTEIAKNNLNITQNLVSMIDLCTCQNFLNAMLTYITMFIWKKTNQEIFFPSKGPLIDPNNPKNDDGTFTKISITLTGEHQFIIIDFSTYGSISYKKVFNAKICAYFEYSLKINLKEETFLLEKFKLSYDLNKCIPDDMRESESEPTTFGKEAYNFVSNNRGAIATGALALGVGATVGTLFLTGVLGGKSKKYKKYNKLHKSNKLKIIKSKKRKHNKKYTRKLKKSKKGPLI